MQQIKIKIHFIQKRNPSGPQKWESSESSEGNHTCSRWEARWTDGTPVSCSHGCLGFSSMPRPWDVWLMSYSGKPSLTHDSGATLWGEKINFFVTRDREVTNSFSPALLKNWAEFSVKERSETLEFDGLFWISALLNRYDPGCKERITPRVIILYEVMSGV